MEKPSLKFKTKGFRDRTRQLGSGPGERKAYMRDGDSATLPYCLPYMQRAQECHLIRGKEGGGGRGEHTQGALKRMPCREKGEIGQLGKNTGDTK